MKNKILLHKLNSLSLYRGTSDNQILASTFQAECMNLGYILSSDLYNVIVTMDENSIVDLLETTINELKFMKGDHVVHKPMYKGFPKEVMDMSMLSLFINAITHYWSGGLWLPEEITTQNEIQNHFSFKNTNFITINLANKNDFNKLVKQILTSQTSINEFDMKILEHCLGKFNNYNITLPVTIPFKENMVVLANYFIQSKQEEKLKQIVKTSTDVLRIISYISKGDASLTINTKFKSLPRSLRRLFVNILEEVISEEDIKRHQKKWNKLFHNLHIGEYKQAKKCNEIAKKIRNKVTLKSVGSAIEEILNPINKVNTLESLKWIDVFFEPLETKYTETVTKKLAHLLSKRPGDFARRLDHVIRTRDSYSDIDVILNVFDRVISKIATKVLLQLMGHFSTRNNKVTKRVAIIKGDTSKAYLIKKELDGLDSITVNCITNIIKTELTHRFKQLDPLGKIYIDEKLKQCPIPLSQRNASTGGTFTVARGTRLPFGDKETLRFFIYWVGQDIDLSATLHDEKFNLLNQISYTHLKSDQYKACHSGDITAAPTGASEFIDITVDTAYNTGARYVVMNVLVFSGPTFAEHDKVFAGFMTKDGTPDVNRDKNIYNPKDVQFKINLDQKTKNMIPLVFDLKERTAIFTDLSTQSKTHWGGNNVESNYVSIKDSLESITNLDNKPNLYDLFSMHSIRGTLVNTPEEADTLFTLDKGITPYNINEINAEYIN